MPSDATHPTRKRIIKVATGLFQERGFYAVGITEVLKAAEVPKGSLYHHFPGGKTEVALASLDLIGEEVLSLIEGGKALELPVSVIVANLAKGMGHWLERSDWRQGCLIGTLAQEVSANDGPLRDAVVKWLSAWEAAVADCLMAEGHDDQKAKDLSMTIISALEGALISARVSRSMAPLYQSTRALGLLL